MSILNSARRLCPLTTCAVFAGALCLASPARAGAAPSQAAKPAGSATQALPPLSYVCVMPGDEDVMEDKPGTCPKCKMTLVPVRLDAKWWCPVHQSLEVHDGPGKCRRDGRDLVQVTVAESWTCSDAPDVKHLEPGACADGSPRRIKYELRAHGDHNPRHGGQFFMASDAWHHIEGAYPQAGLFRVYFYDNFTKPLVPKDFGGSVVIRDASDKELATVPLEKGSISNTLEARIPPAQSALPLRVTANVRFSATGKEQGFDFQFNQYSKDPQPTASLRSGPDVVPARLARMRVRHGSRVALERTPVRAVPAVAVMSLGHETQLVRRATAFVQAQSAALRPGASQQAPTASAQPPDLLAGEIAPMPPALAAALDESVLPKTIPALVTELRKRVGDVDSLVKQGSLAEVWLPAMATKTVALVLGDRAGDLPAARQADVASAVSRVVSSTWLIDGYGDLGNRAKIVEAYDQLASAVGDLEGAYANAP